MTLPTLILNTDGSMADANAAALELLRVTLDEAAQADEIVSVLMGDNVEARKEFIVKNAKDVRFLDI